MTDKKAGFTLLETIVAILVVDVALLALLSLMNYTSISSRASANRLIALNLVQEGMEVVRNSRDTSNNWNSWFNSDAKDGDYRARIALTSPYDWELEKSSSGFQLRFNDALGLYHHENNGDPLSIFSRRIRIDEVAKDQRKIVVTVDWTSYGKNYSIATEQWLYNWNK